jgi:hypothetical protein
MGRQDAYTGSCKLAIGYVREKCDPFPGSTLSSTPASEMSAVDALELIEDIDIYRVRP